MSCLSLVVSVALLVTLVSAWTTSHTVSPAPGFTTTVSAYMKINYGQSCPNPLSARGWSPASNTSTTPCSGRTGTVCYATTANAYTTHLAGTSVSRELFDKTVASLVFQTKALTFHRLVFQTNYPDIRLYKATGLFNEGGGNRVSVTVSRYEDYGEQLLVESTSARTLLTIIPVTAIAVGSVEHILAYRNTYAGAVNGVTGQPVAGATYECVDHDPYQGQAILCGSDARYATIIIAPPTGFAMNFRWRAISMLDASPTSLGYSGAIFTLVRSGSTSSTGSDGWTSYISSIYRDDLFYVSGNEPTAISFYARVPRLTQTVGVTNYESQVNVPRLTNGDLSYFAWPSNDASTQTFQLGDTTSTTLLSPSRAAVIASLIGTTVEMVSSYLTNFAQTSFITVNTVSHKVNRLYGTAYNMTGATITLNYDSTPGVTYPWSFAVVQIQTNGYNPSGGTTISSTTSGSTTGTTSGSTTGTTSGSTTGTTSGSSTSGSLSTGGAGRGFRESPFYLVNSTRSVQAGVLNLPRARATATTWFNECYGDFACQAARTSLVAIQGHFPKPCISYVKTYGSSVLQTPADPTSFILPAKTWATDAFSESKGCMGGTTFTTDLTALTLFANCTSCFQVTLDA